MSFKLKCTNFVTQECIQAKLGGILTSDTRPYFSGLTVPDDVISLPISTNGSFENRNEVPFVTIEELQGGMIYDNINNRVTVPNAGLYSVTISSEVECPGSLRILSAIAINGNVGSATIAPFNIPLYGLNMNEYPGIGGNVSQGSSAILKLSGGDQISFVHGYFTGGPGTYSLFTTRMQVVQI